MLANSAVCQRNFGGFQITHVAFTLILNVCKTQKLRKSKTHHNVMICVRKVFAKVYDSFKCFLKIRIRSVSLADMDKS